MRRMKVYIDEVYLEEIKTMDCYSEQDGKMYLQTSCAYYFELVLREKE